MSGKGDGHDVGQRRQLSLGAGDDQVQAFEAPEGLPISTILVGPPDCSRIHSAAMEGRRPIGDDQIRPGRLQRVGARRVDVVQRRPAPAACPRRRARASAGACARSPSPGLLPRLRPDRCRPSCRPAPARRSAGNGSVARLFGSGRAVVATWASRRSRSRDPGPDRTGRIRSSAMEPAGPQTARRRASVAGAAVAEGGRQRARPSGLPARRPARAVK